MKVLKNLVLLVVGLIVLNFNNVFSQEKTHQEGAAPNKTETHSPAGNTEHHEEDNTKLDIISKVVDHDYVDFYMFGKLHLPKFAPVHLGPIELDFSITKSMFMMLVASLLLVIVLAAAASSNTKNRVPKGLGNLIESIIVFVRDDIVVANMGKDGLKLLPFFLTIFFFILFANFIGLFPFMAQPTKNVNVTAALALITFGATQAMGMKKNGVWGYLKGLVPPGIPVFVLPIMIIVEFIGLFTKPFSLLMRLFANITAGTIIILSLVGLIFIMGYVGSVIAVPFALFIYLLEIFVALLQAYIFTMLSVLYVNMAMHQDH